MAEFPFTYYSAFETEKAVAAVRAQVPPVFQRSFEPFERFRKFTSNLSARIAETQIAYEGEGKEALSKALAETAENLIEESGRPIEADTILRFTSKTSPKERSSLMNDASDVLRSTYEDGIYSTSPVGSDQGQVTMIQMVDEQGRANLPSARSIDEAQIALRVRLNALSRDSETARLLFEIFDAGLEPNLFYSEPATQLATERAIAQIETKPVQFKEGDTLVEPGAIITEADLERLEAYRQFELREGSFLFNELFINRLTLSVLLLVSIYIYLKQGLLGFEKRNRALAVMAVSILFNLLLMRR